MPCVREVKRYVIVRENSDSVNNTRWPLTTLRSHRKTWRPLFSLLLEIIIVNSFKLSTLSVRAEVKRSGQHRFRLKLVMQLEDAAGRPAKFDRRRQSVNDLHVQNGVIHKKGRLFKDGFAKACAVCAARGRGSQRRQPLQVVDSNRVAKKPALKRTVKGCTVLDN